MFITNTNIPKLNTIDAETLMVTPLPPIEFIVDTLIAPGLYLLVGDSKIGKSWLILQLCLKIAKGEPFWGLATKQGNVLYLSLEDNLPRLQGRLFEIADDGHKNLEMALMAQDLAHGLILQIEDFIAGHPATKIVVIDTLQKVRGLQVDMSGTYANDYKEMGLLKSLADKYRITILLVHHTSKRPNESDPFKKISGTTAIMGASDGCMILTKENPFDKRAKLAVTGRDIESKAFSVLIRSKPTRKQGNGLNS